MVNLILKMWWIDFKYLVYIQIDPLMNWLYSKQIKNNDYDKKLKVGFMKARSIRNKLIEFELLLKSYYYDSNSLLLCAINTYSSYVRYVRINK